MLTNPPYYKKWCNTNIQRGNGAMRLFSASIISLQIVPDFRSSLISLMHLELKDGTYGGNMLFP